MKRKSFTLIELLVVIAIIGLLSSIVLVSINGVRAKARDVRRKSDINAMVLALELYYDNNGEYPPSGGASSPNSSWSNSNDSSWTTLGNNLSEYLDNMPVDPTNAVSGWAGGGEYTYGFFSLSYGCGQQWYMLVYKLEGSGDSPGVTACDGHFFNYGGTITVGNCNACN